MNKGREERGGEERGKRGRYINGSFISRSYIHLRESSKELLPFHLFS